MSRPIDPSNKGRMAVLRAFRQNPGASIGELVSATGMSQTGVYHHLTNLRNEGVITRENKPRGVYVRSARPAKVKAKSAVVKVDTKKSMAGKQGRGDGAFIPGKTKKVDALQERIDKVVAAAKAKEAAGIEQHDGGDVMRDKLSLFHGSRVRGSKI